MRFRLGLIIGFGAGYYFGAMAGRERYEQMNRLIQRAKESDAFDTATDKARAVVDLGVERARDLVTSDEPGNGHGPGPDDVGSGSVREPFPRTSGNRPPS
jgi:hypothetical protein